MDRAKWCRTSQRAPTTITRSQIKKRQMQGLLGDQQIWAHGQDTFYNIQSFDVRTSSLVGVRSIDRHRVPSERA